MPIDSAGIGEALKRSASSMYAAGNTMEETIGLVTAANAVVQDPDTLGRVLPSIKVAISVKIQRWLRPSKDLIDIVYFTYQLGRVCFYNLQNKR